MFVLDGVPGRYPALSLTGGRCELMCDHCRGSLLAPMIAADSPELLVARCRELEREGHPGVLVSGGCDADGCLPWERFLPAIRRVKATTRLHVSVHAGFIHRRDALGLKAAGVDQALVDLVGDDDTLRRVCHVPFGVERVAAALEALHAAGIPVVPHIVCGLDGGRMVGEERALDLVARFRLEQLVVLSFMGLPGTPAAAGRAAAPRGGGRADCARPAAGARSHDQPRLRAPRGASRLDVLAVDAGVNRMALPSEEAVVRAPATTASQSATSAPAAPCRSAGQATAGSPCRPSRLESRSHRDRARGEPKMSDSMAVTDTTPSSPGHLRMSLAAAMTLGWAPGLFYRDARLYCINLLLTYPEGCRARCAYCGLAAGRQECADGGRSFIRVQWPAFPLEDIVHRIAARRERIRRVCISMVTRRRAVADTAAVCRRLRAAVDLPVSLLITPTVLRPGDLEALRAAGADKVGVAVDLATPALFDRYRGGGVAGPHRWEVYWECYGRAIEVFGRGRAGVHLIVGMGETEQEMCAAVQRARDMGGRHAPLLLLPGAGLPVAGPPAAGHEPTTAVSSSRAT